MDELKYTSPDFISQLGSKTSSNTIEWEPSVQMKDGSTDSLATQDPRWHHLTLLVSQQSI